MKILFWLYRSRINKRGEAPVKMRISINAKRIDFSTGIEVTEDLWDSVEQRIKGVNELANQYNSTLMTLRALAWDCYNHNLRNNFPVDVEIIKSYILAKDKPNYTLSDALDYQIANLKARVGNDVAALTVKKYETIKRKILDYLNKRLKRKDFLLNELSNKFIFDFDNYLRTDGKLGHNAVAKNMQQFRRVIKVAVQNEWIPKDPFTNYRCSPKETERGFLSIEEVQSLEAITLTERLDKVRDLFLFCCYTGLAYADVSKLNKQHLMNGEDGNTWIILSRTKTKSQSLIPLLPQALGIMEKYAETVKLESDKRLLPIISNQNLNKYIKEIAVMVGIKKRVSMHLARHTFATTITLNRGVDIVSVSKMLGHKNLRTTQIYAKTGMLKIAEDMKKLM